METSAYFVISELKSVQSIDGWQEFFDHGNGYLGTAVAAFEKRKKAYSAGILYNLVAMAIEKFVMAALMRHGTMPYNHTMVDLVEAMEKTFPGELTELRAGLLQLDKYQEICDLEGFSISPPAMEEIPSMLVLAGKMKSLVIDKISFS
ncbi:MAG: hypothetical protein AMK70_06040 [Nitrospira bacterium SG8_35_1]|nr:MAG: hypothetical protein AMK70_06040 [Nitrospira bacterium SG8_35_1]